ncbi:MAG: hypothetical protein HY556_10090 [Euryarchaeota archaeon]|nr:hypothetical protein [Euryarchaeota archaeon]
MTAKSVLALAIGGIVLSASTGCIGAFTVAEVPRELLGANGWQFVQARSDAAPRQANFGLSTIQTKVYQDPGGGSNGYPASLSVTTLKGMLLPTEQDLREKVRAAVIAEAEARGIRIGVQETGGERQLKSGHPAFFFEYNGTVERSGFFTSSSAEAKIMGEVWNCQQSGTSVVSVALAQTTNVTTVGGILRQTDENPMNWRELVSDPAATIDGFAGDLGLMWNVECRR